MSKEYRNSIRSRKSIRTAYAELVSEKKDSSKIIMNIQLDLKLGKKRNGKD